MPPCPYLARFLRHSSIFVENRRFELPSSICRPRWGDPVRMSPETFGIRILESLHGMVRPHLRDPKFVRFDTVPECDGRTYGRTDTRQHIPR